MNVSVVNTVCFTSVVVLSGFQGMESVRWKGVSRAELGAAAGASISSSDSRVGVGLLSLLSVDWQAKQQKKKVRTKTLKQRAFAEGRKNMGPAAAPEWQCLTD